MDDIKKQIQKVKFGEFKNGNMADLFPRAVEMTDVPVRVVVELGQVRMKISEILNLKVGSVVVLSKGAGEPVDVIVNNRRIGEGEILLVDDRLSCKVSRLVTSGGKNSVKGSDNA